MSLDVRDPPRGPRWCWRQLASPGSASTGRVREGARGAGARQRVSPRVGAAGRGAARSAARCDTKRAVRDAARALARAEARLPERARAQRLAGGRRRQRAGAELTILALRPKPERSGPRSRRGAASRCRCAARGPRRPPSSPGLERARSARPASGVAASPAAATARRPGRARRTATLLTFRFLAGARGRLERCRRGEATRPGTR